MTSPRRPERDPSQCPDTLLAFGLAACLVSAGATGMGAVRAFAEEAGTPAPNPPRQVFGRIRGSVFDAARRPLSGLMVQLTARDQGGLLRVTGTDEKGQYRFQDLPAGHYDVEIGSEVHGRQKKSGIEVRPPFQNIVDFEFGAAPAAGVAAARPAAPGMGSGDDAGAGAAPGAATAVEAAATAQGTLLDQQRRPIPEVSVVFVSLAGAGVRQAFSGLDGIFQVGGLRPGRYRVLISSPGHITLDLPSVEVAPETGVSMRLTLVDHPLNFKGRPDAALPRESPRSAPTPAPTPAPVTPASS